MAKLQKKGRRKFGDGGAFGDLFWAKNSPPPSDALLRQGVAPGDKPYPGEPPQYETDRYRNDPRFMGPPEPGPPDTSGVYPPASPHYYEGQLVFPMDKPTVPMPSMFHQWGWGRGSESDVATHEKLQQAQEDWARWNTLQQQKAVGMPADLQENGGHMAKPPAPPPPPAPLNTSFSQAMRANPVTSPDLEVKPRDPKLKSDLDYWKDWSAKKKKAKGGAMRFQEGGDTGDYLLDEGDWEPSPEQPSGFPEPPAIGGGLPGPMPGSEFLPGVPKTPVAQTNASSGLAERAAAAAERAKALNAGPSLDERIRQQDVRAAARLREQERDDIFSPSQKPLLDYLTEVGKGNVGAWHTQPGLSGLAPHSNDPGSYSIGFDPSSGERIFSQPRQRPGWFYASSLEPYRGDAVQGKTSVTMLGSAPPDQESTVQQSYGGGTTGPSMRAATPEETQRYNAPAAPAAPVGPRLGGVMQPGPSAAPILEPSSFTPSSPAAPDFSRLSPLQQISTPPPPRAANLPSAAAPAPTAAPIIQPPSFTPSGAGTIDFSRLFPLGQQVAPAPARPAAPAAPAPATRAAAPARPGGYSQALQAAEQKYGLPPGLLHGVMMTESSGNPNAVRRPQGNDPGSHGLMQFTPATARQYGIDPRDPYQSIDAAGRYLQHSMNLFGGDLNKAIASYNAGAGAVSRGRIPPPTAQTYVPRVRQNMAKAPYLQNISKGLASVGGGTQQAQAQPPEIPKAPLMTETQPINQNSERLKDIMKMIGLGSEGWAKGGEVHGDAAQDREQMLGILREKKLLKKNGGRAEFAKGGIADLPAPSKKIPGKDVLHRAPLGHALLPVLHTTIVIGVSPKKGRKKGEKKADGGRLETAPNFPDTPPRNPRAIPPRRGKTPRGVGKALRGWGKTGR